MFPSNLIIRLLNRADLPALEWEGQYSHFRRMYREIYQSVCQDKALMWVADLPGKGVIGQLFVQLENPRTELADGVECAYMYGIRIKPAYQGFGIGAQLLSVVEKDLKQRNYSMVTLNVGKENHRARKFYERHGYCVVGEVPGRWSYPDDQGHLHHIHEPSWRMEKAL